MKDSRLNLQHQQKIILRNYNQELENLSGNGVRKMDQPSGNPKTIFDAIVTHMETQKLIREFDNVDHTGNNIPTPEQIKQAMGVVCKARELRKIIDN
jgi:hypothetical protein